MRSNASSPDEQTSRPFSDLQSYFRSDKTTGRIRSVLSASLFGICLGLILWQGSLLQQNMRTERNRRIRSGFWEQVIYESQTAVVAIEADTGLVVDWNMGARRLLGWSSREVIGSDFGFLLSPDLQRTCRERFDDPVLREQLLQDVLGTSTWVHSKAGQPKKVLLRIRGFAAGGRYYYIVTMDLEQNVIELHTQERTAPAPEHSEPEPLLTPAEVTESLLPTDVPKREDIPKQ